MWCTLGDILTHNPMRLNSLIKHVEWMFGIVWPPPNFQHVGLSNMKPTCWIVQHLSFGRAFTRHVWKPACWAIYRVNKVDWLIDCVPTSPRPRVPASSSPRVPTSPVPASPSHFSTQPNRKHKQTQQQQETDEIENVTTAVSNIPWDPEIGAQHMDLMHWSNRTFNSPGHFTIFCARGWGIWQVRSSRGWGISPLHWWGGPEVAGFKWFFSGAPKSLTAINTRLDEM